MNLMYQELSRDRCRRRLALAEQHRRARAVQPPVRWHRRARRAARRARVALAAL